MPEEFDLQDREKFARMSVLAGLLFHEEDDAEIKGLLGGICLISGILSGLEEKVDNN